MASLEKQLAVIEVKLAEKIKKAMMNDVFKVVAEEMTDAIENVFYAMYSPDLYDRRRSKGGLSDIRNVKPQWVGSGVMFVRNLTPTNNAYQFHDDGYVDEYVVPGIYNWGFSRIAKSPFARDFYQWTADVLEDNGKHAEAFKKGLIKQGLDVR